ncbi:MAG: (2Fe-2S)-binding protein [Clostridia bacterium]
MDREEVCRCEEVTREDILSSIKNGDRSLEAVKKRTRAGMGFCQGRTCKRLIARILSEYYDLPIDTFLPGSIRIPVGPLSLKMIATTKGGADADN